MKVFLKYISVIVCFFIIMGSVPVFSENDGLITDQSEGKQTDPDSFCSQDIPLNIEVEELDYHEEFTVTDEENVVTEILPDNTEESENNQSVSLSFNYSSLYFDISEVVNNRNIVELLGVSTEGCKLSDISWSVSDSSVAVIESETLKVNKPGRVKVRAELSSNNSVYAEATINIEVMLFIFGVPEEIKEGENFNLRLVRKDGSAVPETEISWYSSDEACVTASGGTVNAVKAGNATVKAVWNGYEASCNISVAEAENRISASFLPIYTNSTGAYISVNTGDAGQIDYDKITFTPSNGYSSYFSIDGRGFVVPVTQNGILANGAESVTIDVSVTYDGISTIVPVTIKQAATEIVCDENIIVVGINESVDISKYIDIKPHVNADRILSVNVSEDGVFYCNDSIITAIKHGRSKIVVTTAAGIYLEITAVCPSPITDFDIVVPEGNFKPRDTVELSAVFYPEGAEAVLKWISSDNNIAVVDHNGKVSFKTAGEVTITASEASANITKSIKLKASSKAEGFILYKGIYPEKTDFVVAVGKKLTPVIDVYPATVSNTDYYLVSSDSSVLMVYNNGKSVKGIKAGYATVTVYSADGGASMQLNFTVPSKKYAITSFSLSASKVTISEGDTKNVKARFNSNAYDKSVEWKSTDPEVATVANGVITGINPGKCTIYALNAAGGYRSIKVNVTMKMPSKVKLNVNKGSMYVGDEYQLTATISPAEIPREEALVLTWKTSNKNVVIVNEEGKIFAVSPGKATITVTTVNGKNATCKVTVKPYKVTSIQITHDYSEFIVGGMYDLDVIVGPDYATNTEVTWSTSSSSRASINKNTGVVKCKKAGTVTITARAKDGSGKKHSIKIRIVKLPLISSNVTLNGVTVGNGDTFELQYKNTMQVNATIEPAMYIDYASSDERIASIDQNGLITATGCGLAKITVTAGGQHKYYFYINVPYDENAPRYRALVISQYAKSGDAGYLPFSTNSTNGIIDALSLSDLEGSRYTVTYKKNFTEPGQVISCINSTFADAREGDVSVIYIITHGNISVGDFRWHLKGTGNKSVWLYPADVMNALANIRGNVVLVVLSCYSGGETEQDGTLRNMISELDNGMGIGESYSVITSTDGNNRSSYVDTHSSFAYDFFTYGLCKSLGWDMTTSTKVATMADTNGDGVISLKELAKATELITREECEKFVDEYGTSAYWGPKSEKKTQNVQYYISDKAIELPVHSVVY